MVTSFKSPQRLLLFACVIAAMLILTRPTQAQQPRVACLPAPQGWSLRVVRATADGSAAARAAGKAGWRAQCLYSGSKASIQVGPGSYEGALADAYVMWIPVPGPCPLPTVLTGSFFTQVKSVDGVITSTTKRAVATYSYEPVDDPFHGGMKALAQRMLAAAEAQAADCTSIRSPGSGPANSDHSMEIASGGLILLVVGGGGLVAPGLLRGRGRPAGDVASGPAQSTPQGSGAPVVVITSPGQGDEVGAYVTVTGTVTGAVSVFATCPGGAGTGSVSAGAFSVGVPVGVQHAAIVVEAVNADGTGRAAVHVFRPDAPLRLAEDEEAHTQALLAQKDAALAAALAHFQAAVSSAGSRSRPANPITASSLPAPTSPKNYDQLVEGLTTPGGGQVVINAHDAAGLLPVRAAWRDLIDVSIRNDNSITVDTPFGSGSATVRAHAGRIVFDAAAAPGHPKLSESVTGNIQAHLDGLTRRIHHAGLHVAEAGVEGGQIWIRTAP